MKFHQYIEDSTSQNIYCCFVGKFSPFHKGHLDAYTNLKSKFKSVYICTAFRDDDFLTGEQKRQLIEQSGIPSDAIKPLLSSGYNVLDLAKSIGASGDDVLVAAFSEKDFEGKQNLLVPAKKDNIAAWVKLPESYDRLETISSILKGRGYIYIAPSKKIGGDIVSSSRIRAAVEEGKWSEIKNLMATQKAFELLQEFKL